MNHGGIECSSASNSLEGTLEKWQKAMIRGTLSRSTEELYYSFPSRSVAADVHGILLRVASLEDTLTGKIAAWRDPRRRQSKRVKDLGDILRLIEAHPQLWSDLPDELKEQIDKPKKG